MTGRENAPQTEVVETQDWQVRATAVSWARREDESKDTPTQRGRDDDVLAGGQEEVARDEGRCRLRGIERMGCASHTDSSAEGGMGLGALPLC